MLASSSLQGYHKSLLTLNFESLEQTETPLQFLCKSKSQEGSVLCLEIKSFHISK